MSSISSPALADSASDLSGLDSRHEPSAKSILTVYRFSKSAGRMSQCSGTCLHFGQAKDLPTSFAAASHAKTSALLEMEQGSLDLGVGSGASTTGSSRKLGRSGRLSKTSQPFALADWTQFSGNLLRSGMTRSGTAYPLQPLARLTGETESGLLPTPSASPYGSNQGGAAGRVGPVRHSLHSMAKHGTWPTPTSRDWKDGSAQSCMNVPVNGLLVRAVHQWPTPTATLGTNGGLVTPAKGKEGGTLIEAVSLDPLQPSGSLNPKWVEWLMGFPLGWTALEPSETPSSRRSRKSSGGQS